MSIDGLIAAERSGDGYSVIGNVVLNARGRGLALGAAGLARGNTIAHPKYWGIQVRPRRENASRALHHRNAVAGAHVGLGNVVLHTQTRGTCAEGVPAHHGS